MLYIFRRIMDIDGMYDALGVDTDNFGCVMLDVKLTGLKHTPAMLAFKDMGFLPFEHHVTLLYGLLKPAIEWRGHIDNLLSGFDSTMPIWGKGLSIFGDGTQDIVVVEVANDQINNANQELKRLPHIDTYAYRPHITLAYMPVGLGQVFIKEVGNWGLGMLGYGTDINYGD
jgi:hypothetical protein